MDPFASSSDESGVCNLDSKSRTNNTNQMNMQVKQAPPAIGNEVDSQNAQMITPVIQVPIFCVQCQRERQLYHPPTNPLTSGIRCSKGLWSLIGGNSQFPSLGRVSSMGSNTQLGETSEEDAMRGNNDFKSFSIEEDLLELNDEGLSSCGKSMSGCRSREISFPFDFDPLLGNLECWSGQACYDVDGIHWMDLEGSLPYLKDSQSSSSCPIEIQDLQTPLPCSSISCECDQGLPQHCWSDIGMKRGIYRQASHSPFEFTSDYASPLCNLSYANMCRHLCNASERIDSCDVTSGTGSHKTKVELGNSRTTRKLDSAYSSLERQTQPLYVRECNISMERQSFDAYDTCTVLTSGDDTDTDSGTEDTSDTDDTMIVYRPTKSCTKEKLQQRTKEMLMVLKEHHVRLIQAVSEQLVQLLQERHELREQVEMRKIAIEQLLRFQADANPRDSVTMATDSAHLEGDAMES